MTATTAARGGPRPSREVLAWLTRQARPIRTATREATADDLVPLRARAADATVVGLGESTRGARTSSELTRLRNRIACELVTEAGFRTIAIEDPPDATRRLNDYVHGDDGTAAAALADTWASLRTVEFAELVAWVRDFNQSSPDRPVRFVGADTQQRADIERRVADNLLAARRDHGKVVHLGGVGHTAVIGEQQPHHDDTHSTGYHLRQTLGDRYVSIGLTFHHSDEPALVPDPQPPFVEHTLGLVSHPTFLLDLAPPHPPSVHAWLDHPANVRVIGPRYDPADDASYHLTGRPAALFDALVHQQRITPATYLDR